MLFPMFLRGSFSDSGEGSINPTYIKLGNGRTWKDVLRKDFGFWCHSNILSLRLTRIMYKVKAINQLAKNLENKSQRKMVKIIMKWKETVE